MIRIKILYAQINYPHKNSIHNPKLKSKYHNLIYVIANFYYQNPKTLYSFPHTINLFFFNNNFFFLNGAHTINLQRQTIWYFDS